MSQNNNKNKQKKVLNLTKRKLHKKCGVAKMIPHSQKYVLHKVKNPGRNDLILKLASFLLIYFLIQADILPYSHVII